MADEEKGSDKQDEGEAKPPAPDPRLVSWITKDREGEGNKREGNTDDKAEKGP